MVRNRQTSWSLSLPVDTRSDWKPKAASGSHPVATKFTACAAHLPVIQPRQLINSHGMKFAHNGSIHIHTTSPHNQHILGHASGKPKPTSTTFAFTKQTRPTQPISNVNNGVSQTPQHNTQCSAETPPSPATLATSIIQQRTCGPAVTKTRLSNGQKSCHKTAAATLFSPLNDQLMVADSQSFAHQTAADKPKAQGTKRQQTQRDNRQRQR